MALEAWLTLAVIVLALALFISEIVTVDLAALLVMSLLLLIGLVTPAEGVSGFSNPATLTVLAMFILSAGIERTGVVHLLAQKVSRVAGKRQIALMAAVVLLVAPVSAFVNNTAAVAALIPLVAAVARDAGHAPSRFLIPLSFAGMLGGVVTLIGTSTNLLVSSVSADLGHGAYTMFEFALPGMLVALVGIVYILGVGRFLLPDRAAAAAARYELDGYMGEVRVGEASGLVDRTLAQAALPRRYDVEVVGVRRGEHVLNATPDTLVKAGDVLLVVGKRERFLELESLENLTFQQPEERARRPADVKIHEAIVTPHSALIGRTVESVRFRTTYGGSVVALRTSRRTLRRHAPIAGTALSVGDSLLIAATKDELARLASTDDLLLLEGSAGRKYRREKAYIAIGIFTLVVGLAAIGVYSILVTSIAGAAAMVVLGVLTMEELHRSIRWDILFLLAGIIPMGIAVQRSGLADGLAQFVSTRADALPPYFVLVILYGVTTILTEVMSNNASAVLLAPVAAAIALDLGLPPKLLMLVVAFAASTSFLTPIGYQTNTMVYGPGGYKFSDYAKIGLPLNLILLFATPWILLEFYA